EVSPATADRSWTSWQLHIDSTNPGVGDRLLCALIAPMLPRWAGHPWFFIRYWQGGPHLRLRVADLTPPAAAELAAELAARLPEVARLRAGEQPVDPVEFHGTAAELARAEGEGSAQELRAMGVYPATYVPESQRYGGVAVQRATEDLFQISSELVLGALPGLLDRAPGQRALWALRATVAAAQALGPDEAPTFYAESLRAWRQWAVRSGSSAAAVGGLAAPGPAPDPNLVAALGDTAANEPWGAWRAGVAELAAELERRGIPAGRVLYSHVHMLHNRLGRSIPEEIRSYIWLAQAYPIEEVAHAR
ncbi:MAG: thiopeptide-type bacteriocin biosynthesis protein, partial [Angustibacter sp.]